MISRFIFNQNYVNCRILMTTTFVVILNSCKRSIICPCGSSSQNYTHCLDNTVNITYTCERWAHCETCKANTTHCVTCPPNRFGPTCTEDTKELIRKKRQYSYNSCPSLNNPDLGSKECQTNGNYRTCTATCLPGYHFKNEDAVSMRLECHGSYWTPRSSFPPCISGGFCSLKIKEGEGGSYNCTTGTDGTLCDITCYGRQKRRYHCYPGRDWYPSLPFCAVPKDTSKIGLLTLCLCQNGGTCVGGGRCRCPSGTTGNHCELESESASRDCNLQITGSGSFNCTTMYVTECDIRCNNVHQGRYRCTSGKNWTPQLPYCTSPKESRSTRQSPCHCENGGSCDRRGTCRCPSGFTGSHCENANCRDPGYVQNGYRNLISGSVSRGTRTNNSGVSFQYSCNQGYKLQGNNILTCTTSGIWSSNIPWCQRSFTANCRDPGHIQNGYRNLRSGTASRNTRTYNSGESFQYSCNLGYKLQGNNILTCTTSGMWSSNIPWCQRTFIAPPRQCSDPGRIQRGSYRNSGSSFGSPNRFNIGQTVEYYCIGDNELVGSSVVRCLPSGSWSEKPSCRRAKRVFCRYPEQNPTSRLMISVRPGQTFLPGTMLTYVCNEGYMTDDALTISCLPFGEWNSSSPTCYRTFSTGNTPRSVVCPTPTADANSEMDYIPPSDSSRRGSGFVAGARVRFTCFEGYELTGTNPIICLDSGEWSTDPPKCISRRTSALCPDPGRFENGGSVYIPSFGRPVNPEILTARGYPVDSKITYNCIKDYRLLGEKDLVCISGGKWNRKKPRCIEDCGNTMLVPGGKISHGTNTKAGEFPWIVFLDMTETGQTCAGVLVNHRTVLSAAHCFESTGNCTLYFGKYFRDNRKDDRNVEKRESIDIVAHPSYRKGSFDNDIAIVKFEPSIQYTNRTQPICMPSPSTTNENLVPGRKGYVAGWGVNEHQVALEKLMMATLPVQASKTCESAYRKIGVNINIKNGMFCAGYNDKEINACRGDSGSPLVFYNNATERFVVEGLVSYGTGGECARAERYTMFTKVSYYLDWIKESL